MEWTEAGPEMWKQMSGCGHCSGCLVVEHSVSGSVSHAGIARPVSYHCSHSVAVDGISCTPGLYGNTGLVEEFSALQHITQSPMQNASNSLTSASGNQAH